MLYQTLRFQHFHQNQQKLEQRYALLECQELLLTIEKEVFSICAEDVLIERVVKDGIIAASNKGLTIALDITLDEELILEGLAREIVNKVNTMRRAQELEVTDRIVLTISSTEKVRSAFAIHKEYIQHEVLASQVEFRSCEGTEWDLNGEKATFAIRQA